jgi:hypothetical protein
MTNNKDNAPPNKELIKKLKDFALSVHAGVCSGYNDNHRQAVMDHITSEYILESTADKLEMELRHECIKHIEENIRTIQKFRKQREEILKPIRDIMEVDQYCRPHKLIMDAIKETLTLADKL